MISCINPESCLTRQGLQCRELCDICLHLPRSTVIECLARLNGTSKLPGKFWNLWRWRQRSIRLMVAA
jgi:hypothetical protein